jgi:hypothetical protein
MARSLPLLTHCVTVLVEMLKIATTSFLVRVSFSTKSLLPVGVHKWHMNIGDDAASLHKG